MIGLFGLYHPESEAPADLTPMAARVPDGYLVDAPSGLGAALGRTAHQHHAGFNRRSTPDGQHTAIALGEIFDIGSLTQAASDGGAETPPTDVAGLVLALAEAGQLDRLAEANGLFCAALYDRKAHRLTLITDRHASFPLHVWRSGGSMVFAGQIHTLLGDNRIACKADPAALAQLFTIQRTVGRVTSIAGVEALPASCIWEIDRDGVRERSYWQLRWQDPAFDESEGAKHLAKAFNTAMARQSEGDRVGLLLSGGMDSRLVLAAAPKHSLSCWTTASYEENPELALARQTAEIFGAEHHALVVPPADTLAVLDRTVLESNGLYPASTPMSVFLPQVGASCTSVLTGHGIDYTLRGYYLPSRFAEIAGSRTRLPVLRPIPRRPRGADVLANLRQGPPKRTIERIVAPGHRDFWWTSQEDAMQNALAPWLESDHPYDAWDAFILHAVSKHYAFTGMMSTRAVADLRMPAFDNEIFDIYLSMPPAWRCSGRMVLGALKLIAPAAARLANANTHFRADLGPWREVLALLGRAALRRLSLVRRPTVPSAHHSAGSWQNMGALFREEPGHRALLSAIRGRLDSLTLGMLDSDGIGRCIDEHLDGRAEHSKLLRQLLTHDSWVRQFGIAGHA